MLSAGTRQAGAISKWELQQWKQDCQQKGAQGPGKGVEDGPRPAPVPTAASWPTVPFKDGNGNLRLAEQWWQGEVSGNIPKSQLPLQDDDLGCYFMTLKIYKTWFRFDSDALFCDQIYEREET
ncbi:hypothetical protein MDA_GLEAN10009164 [Myotis davidii]|uniref:Uncharacterized protein n=1 Tax=Myotis davidii TaxID=225400 RepID=L5M4Y5_MYODS|nr:hypothetical protein MDA_GLEAN10009164 [Myotis davidii]